MPKQRKNELILGRFFNWKLLQRSNVYWADGRSNPTSAGRHSLGTKIHQEALANEANQLYWRGCRGVAAARLFPWEMPRFPPARELDHDNVDQLGAPMFPAPAGLRARCTSRVPDGSDRHAIDTTDCVNQNGSSQAFFQQQLTKSNFERAERTGDYRTVFASLFAETTYGRKSRDGFGLRLLTCDRL